jgi:hypothetical protein
MGDFISKLLELLHEFWPLRVVQVDEQGVLKWGDKAWLCRPRKAPYAFLPGIMEFEKYPARYQGIDCGTQTVDLPSGDAAVFSVNISYDVQDAKVMSTEFEDFDKMLERETRGCLAELFLDADDEEEGSEIAPQDIAAQAIEYLKGLTRGCVDIKAICFTTFTRKARVYRVFNGADG